jgi:hypothetical protein
MAIIIRKSKDEYDQLLLSRQHQPDSAKASIATANVEIKSSDIETAKKIVKSEEIVENLKQELDQQEYLNKKLVKQELVQAANSSLTSTPERPISAASRRPTSAAKKSKIKLK